MLLLKSIKPLKTILENTTFKLTTYKECAKRIYKASQDNKNISNPLVSLRYSIWQGLTIAQRDEVISHCGLSYVGGYYEYSDAHLDTLLNRVLPDTYLIDLVSTDTSKYTSANQKPIIIDEQGYYKMRNGDLAVIDLIEPNTNKEVTAFTCKGQRQHKLGGKLIFKGYKIWHESGDATAFESEYDIIEKTVR